MLEKIMPYLTIGVPTILFILWERRQTKKLIKHMEYTTKRIIEDIKNNKLI